MKETLCIFILILVLIATYDATSPHLTITEIKLGIINQDPEKLSEYIDFPVLRQNLKNQADSLVIRNIVGFDDDPSALFAAGVATAILEKQVDFFITPLGFASILENRFKSKNHACDIDEPITKDWLFQSARLQLNSVDTFFVWIPYGTTEELQLILQRNMLKWKLVDIVFLNPK